jgi:hypothetical protein
MLAVVSEQFPKGGAIAIGMLGGVGMLSAGLLGGPAIGFKQDYNASANLKEKAPEAYERYKAGKEESFFGFKTVGLDGSKVGTLEDNGQELARVAAILEKSGQKDENYDAQAAWWESAKPFVADDSEPVKNAGIFGGKQALKLTAYVPAAMAVCYLLLILFFKAKGGYKAVHVGEDGGH